MQNWGVLILVIMVFVANLPAVMQQWRTDRPGFIKTLWLTGAYALYIALGRSVGNWTPWTPTICATAFSLK